QTAGTCDPADGQCKGGMAKPDKTPCDDDNKCTSSDPCQGALFVGPSASCPAATTCRTASACNPLTGVCDPGSAQNVGMACDDSARCTQGDVCRADGECRGDALVCPAATACLN